MKERNNKCNENCRKCSRKWKRIENKGQKRVKDKDNRES